MTDGSWLPRAALTAILIAALPALTPTRSVAQSQTSSDPVSAAVGATGGEGLPVSVDAEQAIEWHQEQKAYVARGDAVARRGDFTVEAPVLIAYYRELPDGGTEVWRLAADGGVKAYTPTQQVHGDKLVYDVDRQVAVVTGDDLKLITPTDVVTARDSLEYWEARRLAVARGDATATRDRNVVNGDVLIGQFEEQPDGRLAMRRLEAQGNVVITTPTDVARGRHGVYDLETEIATLTGDVRITRGDSQLNGAAAEVNMVTGVSRMISQPGQQDRVRALLVPGDRPGNPTTPNPNTPNRNPGDEP